MKRIALSVLLLTLPYRALAISTKQLDRIPLPGVTAPLELTRDARFEEEVRKLPRAFNFLVESLRRDAKSGRLSLRRNAR